MTLVIVAIIAYLLGLASAYTVLFLGEASHVGESPFADDPRPAALLHDQAD